MSRTESGAEAARPERVHGLGLLDTPPEPHLDAVCPAAALHLRSPLRQSSLRALRVARRSPRRDAGPGLRFR